MTLFFSNEIVKVHHCILGAHLEKQDGSINVYNIAFQFCCIIQLESRLYAYISRYSEVNHQVVSNLQIYHQLA